MNAPGEITQRGQLFRVVFGERDHSVDALLEQLSQELEASSIHPLLSTNVQRDCFAKYALISVMASAGAYFDTSMDVISATPEMRALYIELTKEVDALATAMGIPFEKNIVESNLKMLDKSPIGTTASMQKDLKKGQSSELDGLVFEPVRLGLRYHVPTPCFAKIAPHFGFSSDEYKHLS